MQHASHGKWHARGKSNQFTLKKSPAGFERLVALPFLSDGRREGNPDGFD